MPKPGLRKINRYSETFKATAVKLANMKENIWGQSKNRNNAFRSQISLILETIVI
jgi:hypothetical protein